MYFGKHAGLMFQIFRLLLNTEAHETFLEMVRNCVTALCKINDLQARAGSLPALYLISNQGHKGNTHYFR